MPSLNNFKFRFIYTLYTIPKPRGLSPWIKATLKTLFLILTKVLRNKIRNKPRKAAIGRGIETSLSQNT